MLTNNNGASIRYMARIRTKPSHELGANEVRVVVHSRGGELEKILTLEGAPAGARDLRSIIEAASIVLSMRAEDRPRPALPAHEEQILREAGFKDRPTVGLSATEVGQLEYTRLLMTSLDVAAAARLLKVNTSRIRQRLIARELYGIKDGKRWLLPRFQFVGNRLVPGIERVIPNLPEGLHPIAAVRWFFIPHPDLGAGDDEEPTPPLEWLTRGLDPAPVAELAGEYTAW
jgi:hypothetical protein